MFKQQLFRRIPGYIVIFFIAISVNFLLPRAMPGDPIQLIAGNSVRQMGPEKIAELRSQYGLDKPILEQYLIYLKQIAQGDLGQSYRYSGGKSVIEVLKENFRWTLLLVSTSMFFAILIGLTIGIRSVWSGNRMLDFGLMTAFFTLRSIPPFWLAMILIPIFAVNLGWFPSGDTYSIPRLYGWENFKDILQHAFLPILVLTISYLPISFGMVRVSMLGEIGSDYIRTAKAKGLNQRLVVYRHALRNAVLPMITLFAIDFGQLLGGVTLVEVVFNYRGIGQMMFEAVKSRDYPLLQGGFLLFTIGVLAINFSLDMIYPLLDPTLRDSKS